MEENKKNTAEEESAITSLIDNAAESGTAEQAEENKEEKAADGKLFKKYKIKETKKWQKLKLFIGVVQEIQQQWLRA